MQRRLFKTTGSRYALNFIAVLITFVALTLVSRFDLMNRYTLDILVQIGFNIILAVSLNLAAGFLASFRSGTRALCPWARMRRRYFPRAWICR